MASISVVIPLYNKAPHIERALNSIMIQEPLPDEIIVVDDGSTDGSGEIVANLQLPLVKLIRQENRGVSAARNRGIKEAKGELIAFLDADDEWLPGFLAEILLLYEKFPQAGLLATAHEEIMPDGGLKRTNPKIFPSHCQQGLITYLKNWYDVGICSSAIAIKRSIFNIIGGFKEGEIICEDLDMFVRISFHCPFAWSSKRLVRYYKNAGNRTIGFKMWTDEPVISRTAREAIANNLVAPELVEDLKRLAATWQLTAATHLLLQGQKSKALYMLNFAQEATDNRRLWQQLRLLAGLPGSLRSMVLRTNRYIKRLLGKRY